MRIPPEDPEEVRRRDRAHLKEVGWNFKGTNPVSAERGSRDPSPWSENAVRELEDADED